MHSFENSKARINKQREGFVAKCKCGWKSEVKPTREDAIIAFENHAASDPKHKIAEESNGANLFSIFLAGMGIVYILSPIDLVPDYLVGVGWIEDILIGIISIILIKKGLEGMSPSEIFSTIFE